MSSNPGIMGHYPLEISDPIINTQFVQLGQKALPRVSAQRNANNKQRHRDQRRGTSDKDEAAN